VVFFIKESKKNPNLGFGFVGLAIIALWHLGLPDRVCLFVAPFLHHRNPLWLPRVQVDTAHLADMRAQRAVDPRARQAHETPDVDRRPRRPSLPAIGAWSIVIHHHSSFEG